MIKDRVSGAKTTPQLMQCKVSLLLAWLIRSSIGDMIKPLFCWSMSALYSLLRQCQEKLFNNFLAFNSVRLSDYAAILLCLSMGQVSIIGCNIDLHCALHQYRPSLRMIITTYSVQCCTATLPIVCWEWLSLSLNWYDQLWCNAALMGVGGGSVMFNFAVAVKPFKNNKIGICTNIVLK